MRRVVGPERQAVLRARREDAVRLGHPVRHEVVDHHADIGLRAVEADTGHVPAQAGGIQPGHQSLGRGFLVSGRPVDLPGQEQSRNVLQFESGAQRARVHVVVLHGIAGPQDAGLLQAGDGRDQPGLDGGRQAGRDAVRVHHRIVQPLRLKEYLVAVPAREPGHLVLDRWAVARATARDPSAMDGREMQVLPGSGRAWPPWSRSRGIPPAGR